MRILLLALIFSATITCCWCNCECSATSCSCCVGLSAPFHPDVACVNITQQREQVIFSMYLNNTSVDTFTVEQGSEPAEQPANCVVNDDIGWCVLLENVVHNRGFFGTIVGTFSQGNFRSNVVFGNFKVQEANAARSLTGAALSVKRADECMGRCPRTGCQCGNRGACICCSEVLLATTCVPITGMNDVRYLQSSLSMDGRLWINYKSSATAPQAACTINRASPGVTSCLQFQNLQFGQTISGTVHISLWNAEDRLIGSSAAEFRLTP